MIAESDRVSNHLQMRGVEILYKLPFLWTREKFNAGAIYLLDLLPPDQSQMGWGHPGR
jgi:hypothetical protein